MSDAYRILIVLVGVIGTGIVCAGIIDAMLMAVVDLDGDGGQFGEVP